MDPHSLTDADFQRYSPAAKELALSHLTLFRQIPVSMLPSLLQEVVEYDYKFPVERMALQGELGYLSSLSPSDLSSLFAAFGQIGVLETLRALDWVNQPLRFTEEFSAYLWSSNQMDTFQAAATAYGARVRAAIPPHMPEIPRLGIVLIGCGADVPRTPLFAQLRAQGTLFTNVDPSGGLSQLKTVVQSRAAQFAEPYAHWYVDGSAPSDIAAGVTQLSYAGLAGPREALLGEIQTAVSKPGSGPEGVRNLIAHMKPDRLGLRNDSVLDRFKLKLLTEGSGTQIYSTTFVQWSTREILRRAAPLTLMARFTPRQRQRPMNELLSNSGPITEFDPAGSLVDADMAAYYHWINQQRLSGSATSSFLVWFEERRLALKIGPAIPRGRESTMVVTLAQLATSAA